MARASGDIFVTPILKVNVKLFIRVGMRCHIYCNSNMHKSLQQKEKASLCH